MTVLPRVPAPNIHISPAPERYDPQAETDFRRQVEEAFQVVESRAQLDEAGPPRGAGFVREVPTESGNVGTLTLTPIEGAEFNEVHASTQRGNASWGAWAPLTMNGAGNYVDTVDLVEKHNSKIAYRVYVNGVIVQENVVTFDWGTIANVINASVAYDGAGTATVTAKFDSDTATGAAGAEYSPDGITWTAMTVSADRVATFNVTQSTTAKLTYYVRGYNAAAVAGEEVPVEIDKLVESPRFLTAELDPFDNGTDVIFSMIWETPGSVGTGAYSITCRIYNSGTGVFATEVTTLGPATGSATTGTGNGLGDGVANNSYYGEFFLVDSASGNSSYDYRRTVPRLERI